MLNGEQIKEKIGNFTENKEMCGFEIYAAVKNTAGMFQLKRIAFNESEDDNICLELKSIIIEKIEDECSQANFSPIENLANDQRGFYFLEQSEAYEPFYFVSPTEDVFWESDIANTTGILFRISKVDEIMWAYQHVWPMMIPNKSKKNMSHRNKVWRGWEESRQHLSPDPRVETPCSSRI